MDGPCRERATHLTHAQHFAYQNNFEHTQECKTARRPGLHFGVNGDTFPYFVFISAKSIASLSLEVLHKILEYRAFSLQILAGFGSD